MKEETKQVFVVGMHRSGTSVISRMLNMLGAYVGPHDLNQPGSVGEENVKGFWEHPVLVEINKGILSALNMRWDRVSLFHHDQLNGDALQDLRKETQEFITEMDSHGTWVAKDPRTCLTLPFWRSMLQRPVIVWVYRNPLEVARSLQRRNGFSIPFGLALWEKYSKEALYATQDLPIVHANYYTVIQDPVSAAQDLLRQLKAFGTVGLSLPDQKSITQFVDKQYYRERSCEAELSHYLSQNQLQLNDRVQTGVGVAEAQKASTWALKTDVLHFEEVRLRELDLLGKSRDVIEEKTVRIEILKNSLNETEQRLLRAQRSLLKKHKELGTCVVDDELVISNLNLELKNSRKLNRKVNRKLLKAETQLIKIYDSNLWKFGTFVDRIRNYLSPSPPEDVTGQGNNEARGGMLSSRKTERNSVERMSVIICVHNALSDVIRCLESVVQYTDLNIHELIIVDDGSEAETQAYLSGFCVTHKCSLLRNEHARGYTCAANQGLHTSTGDASILLNSDTIVAMNWIGKLKEVANIPGTACVGPLSNAASWQSIPRLTGDDGQWVVNDIPENLSVAEFNDKLTQNSRALFPEVTFVNGFCFLINRVALDEIGYLDEELFPRGYGEEDDFVLRCLKVGFKNRIADHCYVFHAKSKSFTAQGRRELTHSSSKTLKKKHGKALIRSHVINLQQNEDLLRARVSASLSVQRAHHSSIVFPKAEYPLSIAWPQPHLKTVGGIRRVIEMTNRLVAMGHKVTIYTPAGEKTTWLPIHADVRAIRDREPIVYDCMILSDPDNLEMCRTLFFRKMLIFHLALYHTYRPKSSILYDYYHQKDCSNVTNSQWVADNITDYYKTQAVFPGGIDHGLFLPVRGPTDHDFVCYGSNRTHKGTSAIVKASVGHSLLKIADVNPKQSDLALHISRGRVFVSACWHEGFNFCPLEAMACGVPVVMTDDGGSREYAIHEENALVVPLHDTKALREAMQRLLNDKKLRCRLIENGMLTAINYSWRDISIQFSDYLMDQFAVKTR